MRQLEVVGESIQIGYMAGGLDSPSFHVRRKVVITAWVQEESIELMAENKHAAVRFGETLGEVIHETLRDPTAAIPAAHPDQTTA